MKLPFERRWKEELIGIANINIKIEPAVYIHTNTRGHPNGKGGIAYEV